MPDGRNLSRSNRLGPSEPLKVLVIDDDAIALAEMTERLSAAGYKVTNLSSPIGASRVIAHDGIDVVVIDVQMPSIRGDRLAALFRSNPKLGRLGVILVTAASEEEIADLAAKGGADFVLSKADLNPLPGRVRDSHVTRNRSGVPPG